MTFSASRTLPSLARGPATDLAGARRGQQCLRAHLTLTDASSVLEIAFLIGDDVQQRHVQDRVVLCTVKGMGRRGGRLGRAQGWAPRPAAVLAATLCSYLCSHPSLRSHTWSLEAPQTAQGASRSGPRTGSGSQVFSKNEGTQGMRPQGPGPAHPLELPHTSPA